MPFNKEGDWINCNPIGIYLNLVRKSISAPGTGGPAWTSEYRKKLHDAAARFHLDTNNIPFSENNFLEARRYIESLLTDSHTSDEHNGFNHEPLPRESGSQPQSQSQGIKANVCSYTHIGD